MALNSMIRKIPLLGNCDLTNFKTEIHDYEGFEQDNSFFLNKRKVNWWKRNVSGGEIGGGLSGVINGNYFDIFKDNSFIGKISREYYKRESVSAEAWRSETLQQVVNPFPADDNTAVTLKNKFLGKKDKIFVEKCGNYYFVGDVDNSEVIIYDSQLNEYDRFSLSSLGVMNISYISFFYRPNGYHFSYTFTDTSWEHPEFVFNLNYDEVYIYIQTGSDGAEGYTYSLSTKTVSNVLGRGFLGVSDFTMLSWQFPGQRGAWGLFYKNIDNGQQHVIYHCVVVNNNLYIQLFNKFTNYETNELKLFFNSEAIDTRAPGYDSEGVYIYLYKGVEIPNVEQSQYIMKAFARSSEYYSRIYALPNGQYARKVYNYSKKYGPWTINYYNNVASNIAHNFKKLYEIEGYEENGVVLAIDGYNDTYIYFHYGSNYFRISIDTAENFADVAKSLNNIYFIFNTVSYKNAFYSGGNDWFCSCDDWNDRVLWYVDSDDFRDIQTTSRLNDKWQNLSDVVSVSDQMAPIQTRIAVRPNPATMTAYTSSATWDGESVIYDISGNIVDTSSWEYNHSLAGYYYAATYISEPAKIVPFFLDENYTCPDYLDENLEEQKQRYTVYFPVNPPYDGESALAKQGYLTVDGFTVQVDEGDIFAVPESAEDYQRTPALLDTTYLVYISSVIISNKGGNYSGIISALLGGMWTLIFLDKIVIDPTEQGDSVFIINGVEYSYRAESNRILDYTGQFVCNTALLKYIGFSTHCAYFYSEWDKSVYIFEGDNALKKLIPLERYSLAYSVYEEIAKIDTLNIPSLDVVIVNLDTAVLVLFDNQFVILETGKVNSWAIDELNGTFIVNGVMYSLIKSALNYGNSENNDINVVPIKIETQFYGKPDDESNMINDCVYLKIDNLMALSSGAVKIKAVGLCNNKVVEAEEKILKFKTEDFNSLAELFIKYQPKLQECRGFKLFIESDFEIAELKIGTSQGAMNQTTKRI